MFHLKYIQCSNASAAWPPNQKEKHKKSFIFLYLSALAKGCLHAWMAQTGQRLWTEAAVAPLSSLLLHAALSTHRWEVSPFPHLPALLQGEGAPVKLYLPRRLGSPGTHNLSTAKAQCFPAQNNLPESQVTFHISLIAHAHAQIWNFPSVNRLFELLVFTVLACLCQCMTFQEVKAPV